MGAEVTEFLDPERLRKTVSSWADLHPPSSGLAAPAQRELAAPSLTLLDIRPGQPATFSFVLREGRGVRIGRMFPIEDVDIADIDHVMVDPGLRFDGAALVVWNVNGNVRWLGQGVAVLSSQGKWVADAGAGSEPMGVGRGQVLWGLLGPWWVFKIKG